MMIPYVAGMSEDIRHVCRKFDIRVVFKSRWTARSQGYTTVSPAAVARFTLGRPNGDWRPD